MANTHFAIVCQPDQGKVLSATPVSLPAQIPYDDPDRLDYPKGAYYPGEAVRVLLRQPRLASISTWVDPEDWEWLFEQMGWNPDRIVVHAALWAGEYKIQAIVEVW